MKLFSRKNKPVFLKDGSGLEKQLETLKALKLQLSSEGQRIIQKDIKNLEYGIVGEKNIAFELKNSHMPMYILHDVYLEHDGLQAQIDYLVFTNKVCFVIECKNLYGNIQVNNNGDFIRSTEYRGMRRQEGIYSPITQNQRHLDLIKKMIIDRKKNILLKFVAKSSFDDFYKPVVVLANPKTMIDTKYAKKKVKEKIIRADQLVKYIKEAYKQSRELPSLDTETRAWAQGFLNQHVPIEKDYTSKYEPYKFSSKKTMLKDDAILTTNVHSASSAIQLEDTELYKELRAFRLYESRKEKIKPYYIYSNNELKNLILSMPRSIIELRQIEGFGKIKTEKYGDAIINIINKYR